MARLIITSTGFRDKLIELRLGVNRIGRSAGNDFLIEHPTISSRHCEIVLGNEGVRVHDCSSTNGTFLEGQPIAEALLAEGQILRLGDVELLVESADVTVAIPKFEVPVPAPPVVLRDGSMICPRHPGVMVTHQCTHCREVMCDDCVHRLRRRGGKTHKLCPLCSHRCVPLGGEKRRKLGFLFGLLDKTVKLPFFKSKTAKDDH